MVKRLSIKGTGKKILFEEAVKSIEEKLKEKGGEGREEGKN